MHKLKEKEGLMCKLCDLQEKFLCAIEGQMGNLAYLDAKEAGEVIDIIKDLSETQYYITKSAYYQEVVKAMSEPEEMKYNESRMGYNNRRYADGRYAPAGRGEVYGFEYPPDHWTEPIRMGYQGQGQERGNNSRGNSNYGYSDRRQKYGEPYMNYQDARRFYTESHSEHDKKKMEEHAKEHLHDTIDSMKDIWKDADPAMKQKMKQDLTNLINEMNG